jgi:hypothetical protein
MSTVEEALKERIKELTCLYEVSSIINNADSFEIKATLRAIGISLKKGFRSPEVTEIEIITSIDSYQTGKSDVNNQLSATILVFNKVGGSIKAFLNNEDTPFLERGATIAG